MPYDVVVIGGGVVGCAIARELSRYALRVVVLEKEGDVAEGISKANSGVVHAGFNVRPGSLKARLNLEGLGYFPCLCEELDVPYRLTRKLVVAKDESELPYLRKLLDQGAKNGCSGLSIVRGDRIREIEPLVRGEYALFSERTAVISPYELTIALAESAHRNGVEFRFYAEVVAIGRRGGRYEVATADGARLESDLVVNAAGMRSDQVHSMVEAHGRAIHPCRGEYFVLDKVDESFLHTAVYPVPPADGRGLGIHVTPTTEGNLILGPSAEFIDDPEDTATTKEAMDQLKREAIELIPELRNVPVIRSYAGMRPKLFVAGGATTFEDFVIEEPEGSPGFISLVGIESPGLTSAPAIGKYVVEELVSRRIKLVPRKDFVAERRGVARVAAMGPRELAEACARDPDYGEIVCRCNHVSRAELLAAIDNPLGARTLNAIKKRCHAMMGRCQGGFCVPKILELLTEERGRRPEEAVMNAKGSEVLVGYEA